MTQASAYSASDGAFVADNFHYMDEDEHSEGSTYATYDAAVAACRALVDRSLAWHHKPGMTADALYDAYTSFGDDPFVIGLGGAPLVEKFSAWTYAKERCRAICGGAGN